MKKNNNGHDKRERETAAFAKVVSEFAKNLESYMKKPESSSEEEEISFDFSSPLKIMRLIAYSLPRKRTQTSNTFSLILKPLNSAYLSSHSQTRDKCHVQSCAN